MSNALEQKRPLYIMVYHKNGMEWKAISVKLGHFKNINGTQGKASYIVKFMDGEIETEDFKYLIGKRVA